jgi:DNA repair protein RecO (recombination protein O)
MLVKDDGIILAVARSGDTSQIATFLSRRTGKVRLMAKGVLSSKHPARGLLEPGNHLEVLFYQKPNRTLYFIKEAALIHAPDVPRNSLNHMATLLAYVELLDKVCYPGSPDEHIVDLAIECARSCNSPDPLYWFLAFEIRLLELLGAAPEVSSCAACGDALESGVYLPSEGVSYCPTHGSGLQETIGVSAEVIGAARICLAVTFAAAIENPVSLAARKDLGKVIHWTYTYHVQGYSLPVSLNLI